MHTFEDPEIYRDILERLSTGLCVVDLQKRIVLWSDGLEQITGRRRHEVIGHSCVGEALLHCDHQDCEWCHEDCPLARAMKTSRHAESLGFLHHKDGHEVFVRARAIPARTARGSIIGAVAIFEEPQHILGTNCRESQLPGCIDEITGIASRAMMQAHLREALAAFSELHLPLSVLGVRLEGLEHFRSRFGSDAASSLLCLVARTLESNGWKSSLVGRWKDNEFLLILNGCTERAVHSVRERVRCSLANDGIEWWGERHSLPISIAETCAQPGDTLALLLERLERSFAATTSKHSRLDGGNKSTGAE